MPPSSSSAFPPASPLPPAPSPSPSSSPSPSPSPSPRPLARLAALLFAGLLAGCATEPGEAPAGDEAAASAPMDVPPPIAAPDAPPPEAPRRPAIDERDYAFARLDNGLDALLISDPEADKAAAALSVATGSFADPADRQGLAHFLEHMLFLGTEKYPEPDAYQQFISTHGGSHNAYTAFDHTNYFFEIAPDRLRGALDRFAQFFVAPLFNEQYVQREMKAVHSEYQMQLKDDGWRIYQTQKLALNPEHPAAQFNIGSLETLRDAERPIREDLLAFYHAHYSAERMALVVLGREDTATLERWARQLFSPAQTRETEEIAPEEPLFREADLPSLLRARPIKDTRRLELTFEIPPLDPVYPYAPDDYLGNLLGHEGEGSLHAWLKGQGWIDSLAAGSERIGDGAAVMNIRMELTESGRENWRAIGNAVFAYIERIRAAGIEASRFDEQSRLARLDFDYREPRPPMRHVRSLASNMLIYPAEDVLRGPYALDRYRPELIRSYLAHLTPERVQVTLVAPDAETDSVEKWFEVPYALEPLPESLVAEWSRPGSNSALHMPAANPFVPDSLAMIDAAPGGTPERVIGSPALELWHLADTQFAAPRANLRFELRSDAVAGTPRNAALASLYVRLVLDELNAYAYPARLAGLSYDLSAQSDGIALRISGFDDRQRELLARVLETLVGLEIDAERFAHYKRELARDWRNSRKERPYTQALAALGRTLQSPAYTPEALVAAIEPVTRSELEAWRERFLADPRVIALVHGNLQRERARALAEQVRGALNVGEDGGPVPERRLVRLDPGERVTRPLAVEHDDASIAYYVQGEARDWAARARYGLLAHMLRPAYFDSLRTEQQLGYVVAAVPWTRLNTPGIAFVVQSPVVSAGALTRRTQAFLETFNQRLETMDASEFEAQREGLLAKLLERDKNLADRARRLWGDLDTGITTFDSRERIAAAVRELDLETFRAFYARFRERAREAYAIPYAPGRFEGGDSVPSGRPVEDVAAFKRSQDFYTLEPPVPDRQPAEHAP